MMTSDDKVGGWIKKGKNRDDVILECPLVVLEESQKVAIFAYLFS